ncbi:alpha/beta hydrolase [Clostridium aminobutyricum]|uniref:Acetylesterase n=1 Tax=Clostridium aminobutyricum TaxID=33953 RepID=A0A939II11_CLOAM|nr:alpha/beta hydrolase-fold protein [Clostridium aminobutyricum]MBN7772586.1 acetylesterase [Clostridium aminobutyricum]
MIVRGNVFSKTLEMDTGITIVTPNEFKPEGGYKVAYLLHGICGNNGTWSDYTMLPFYASHGKTIYILPEVGRSFYADMKYGFKYFTYVTEELPAICKSVFNISAKREHTAVIGGSMGGYGALKCALAKPEQYGLCGAFSSACLFIKEDIDEHKKNGSEPWFVEMYGEKTIEDFLLAFGMELEWNPKDDILELAKGIQDHGVQPMIYTACGTEDYFHKDNLRFSEEMKQMNFNITYEEWQGKHDFPFFNEALRRVIEKFEAEE